MTNYKHISTINYRYFCVTATVFNHKEETEPHKKIRHRLQSTKDGAGSSQERIATAPTKLRRLRLQSKKGWLWLQYKKVSSGSSQNRLALAPDKKDWLRLELKRLAPSLVKKRMTPATSKIGWLRLQPKEAGSGSSQKRLATAPAKKIKLRRVHLPCLSRVASPPSLPSQSPPGWSPYGDHHRFILYLISTHFC